jgi:hypothetical protein
MMSLKLRRNLSLVLLLLAILTFLALGLGDQPIVAYTAARDSGEAEAPVTLDSGVMNDGAGTTDLLETLKADPGVPEQ